MIKSLSEGLFWLIIVLLWWQPFDVIFNSSENKASVQIEKKSEATLEKKNSDEIKSDW